ncbi:DUF2267 domain-containing protein [Mesorhizobium tianshanense]|uniref:DUF2267 domain-containing protein n=1 Tax=Mesorhizobium tianshanense TaxID=39844 RepID=UPI001F0B6C2C|nr:DUF2267 domain-containing protein [Mesorhizobium tianshanense]
MSSVSGKPEPERRATNAAGLDVFDKTLQTTHTWLDELMDELGPDRQLSWKVLSVVLQMLRDRLPLGLAMHLGAELPLLVRGAYYDQFQPAKQPGDSDRDEFVAEVADRLSDTRPIDAHDAICLVFATLSRHVSRGQVAKIQATLPEKLRAMWRAAEERVVVPPDRGAAGMGRTPRCVT